MHLLLSTSIFILFPATAIIASPTLPGALSISNTDTTRTVLANDEMEVDPSFSIGGDTEAGQLQKRRHVECWDNFITGTARQNAYERDCERLVRQLGSSDKSQTLEPGKSARFETTTKLCKIIVRNQSTCHRKRVYDTAVGIAGRQTLDACALDTQNSGWGFLGEATDEETVYIMEPYTLVPPSYSPRCSRTGL